MHILNRDPCGMLATLQGKAQLGNVDSTGRYHASLHYCLKISWPYAPNRCICLGPQPLHLSWNSSANLLYHALTAPRLPVHLPVYLLAFAGSPPGSGAEIRRARLSKHQGVPRWQEIG